jgi:positive regulator of sigma E activity
VGRFRGALSRYVKGDLRLYLFPQIAVMLFAAVYADADNLLYLFISRFMIPLALVFLIARRYKVRLDQLEQAPISQAA